MSFFKVNIEGIMAQVRLSFLKTFFSYILSARKT